MISTKIQKLKLPIILITLGVLTFGFICTGMANHASMHNGMDTVAMISMGQQECCNTTISKNFDLWKGTLLVLPHNLRDSLMLLALSLVVAFVFIRTPFKYLLNSALASYRFYIRDNPDLALFDHLKLAFAHGILNPKIY